MKTQPTLLGALAPLFVLSAAIAPVSAQQRAANISAPISDVRYDVTADSAALATRQLGVVMRFRVNSTAPVVLALPAWSPGHYTLLWFARKVSAFSATEGGTPLEWTMRDFQTWEIRPTAAGELNVSFKFLADTVDRAAAWARPNFSFFNGTNLFLYPSGRSLDWGASVTIHTEPDWRITTSMDPANEPRTFTAPNFHELTDRPFFVGRFDLDSTKVSDRWIRLATYPIGSITGARSARIFDWLHKFVPQEVAVFGEAPFKRYTVFQVSDTVVNGGGLEHADAQMDELPLSALDAFTPALYSHEFFHSWNVKRLRPADMVPYSYADVQPTRWLWVSEGVTDYYAEVALARSAIIDRPGFLNAMSNDLSQVFSAPPVSVADASLGAWVAPTDGTAGIYYPKGAATGFLLDILIRDATNGKASLDDVMHDVYTRTYKLGRGFTSNDWWSAVTRASGGRSLADFARHYIDGREPLPVDSVVALAGLVAKRETVHEPAAGFAFRMDGSDLVVTAVIPRSPAGAAGLMAGDVIVSIGSVDMKDNGSMNAFRAKYAGTTETTLPLKVRRNGSETTLQLPVRLGSRVSLVLSENPAASAKARTVLSGIVASR